jgi:hypothetical protein
MKNQFAETEQEGSTFKAMGDRFAGVIRSIGMDAFDELKTGVDKAWDEIKMGMDEGIQAATTGVNKAWAELSQSIDRAKDSLFLATEEGQTSKVSSTSAARGKQGRKKEKDNLN